MSRQDKLTPPEIECGRPATPGDDDRLQTGFKLGLDEVAAADEEQWRTGTRRRPSEAELSRFASLLYDDRRSRTDLFRRAWFGEPAWDMLLALYCLPKRGMIISSDYLNEVADVSTVEGLRWQAALHEDGLLAHGPLLKARVQLVQLTDKGRTLLELYLTRRFRRELEMLSQNDADR